MSREICERLKCTGCAACRDICPQSCISLQPDLLGALYPHINDNLCIDCGLCERTCPNNTSVSFHNPQKVLAAWSNDVKVRRTSASGGIAFEFYRYWINMGGVAAGVVYNRDKGCHFVLIEKLSDIFATQNSKYTFSNTDGIYKVVKRKLQDGIPVLFVGVPCQIAGLYGYLKKYYEKLVTVDIICHGMPPAIYLKQHLERIERDKKEYTSILHFRDPKYQTSTFTFTLKNKYGKEFYKKQVLACDNFQLGYHRALIYRENCYHCRYAQKKRISDLTIGDFSGLGRFAPFEFDTLDVSCVIQNTTKGAELLESLKLALTIHERPGCEAFEVEKQLKAPSLKHERRDVFERVYRDSQSFALAANAALRGEKRKAVRKNIILKCRYIARLVLTCCHLKKN